MAIANDVETTMPEPTEEELDRYYDRVDQLRAVLHVAKSLYPFREIIKRQVDKDPTDAIALQRQLNLYSTLRSKHAVAASLYAMIANFLDAQSDNFCLTQVGVMDELRSDVMELGQMMRPPAGQHKVNPAIAEMPPCTQEPISFAPLTWADSL